jgi:protein O-mannosyl-transferase
LSQSKTKVVGNKSIAWLGGALLLGALLAAYGNHFHNGFHMDDGHAIVDNTAIRELRNVPLFFRDATTFSALPSNQSYRPLVSTLLAIDYWLAHGFDPFWFHLSIYLLFCALALLLAFFVRYLLARDPTASPPNEWIAFAAAAWYALNPANADTINYIIASSEVISTLGVIASFACYCAFPRLRRHFLYVLPAAIAILAKPTAAIFPVLFAVFLWLFPEETRRTARTRLVEMVPPFLICGTVLWFVRRMTPRTWVAGAANAHDYLLTQPYVALLYFKTFFWPIGLNADYDLRPFGTAADLRLWMGVAFILLLSAAAIMMSLRTKTRLIGFGLLWFLLALLPTSLFPLAEAMNDHRAFLSNAGLVIATAGGAALLIEGVDWSRRWRKIVAGCAVALFLSANALATFQRNKVWKTEETLWHDVVMKSPRNGRGLMTYGITLVNNGKFGEALPFLQRARELVPPYSLLLINLAIAENATAQPDAAERHYQEALRLAPLAPESYLSYARYLLSHDRAAEAGTVLRRALEISPNDPNVQRLLQESEALDAAAHTKRGDELLHRRNFAEAIIQYEAALAIAPHFASALNNLAWLLSACPEASLRNGAKALELAREGDQLAGGKNPVLLRTLAAAYAENDRFNDAVATAEHAAQLALEQQNASLAKKLEKDLYLYQKNLPLHPVGPKR